MELKYSRNEAKDPFKGDYTYLRSKEIITPPRAKLLESDILPGLHRQDNKLFKNVFAVQ